MFSHIRETIAAIKTGPNVLAFKRCRNQYFPKRCIGLLGHEGSHWCWNDEEDGERTWSWTAGSDVPVSQRH